MSCLNTKRNEEQKTLPFENWTTKGKGQVVLSNSEAESFYHSFFPNNGPLG